MFDLRQFIRVLPVVAIRLHAREVERAVKALRPVLLDLPRVKHCQRVPAAAAAAAGSGGGSVIDPEDPRRYLLLHQGIEDTALKGASAAQASAVAAFLAGPPACPAPVDWPLGLVPYRLELGYEHLTAEAALRVLLPPTLVDGVDTLQTGFEIVGHVAHMNLKEEFLPHKAVIGRVVLDKNPSLRCVVNKTAEISTQFRTFPMEVIAGEDDTRVTLRHGGATFAFDFRAVYWNSRLQHEHELLVRELLLPQGATIADAFAGVGPFAVPAAMPPRGATVHANDLNPASHAALCAAVARNRVAGRVHPTCLDGRHFLAGIGARGIAATHAIMNLPADALSFCDVLVGLFRRGAQLRRAAAGAGAGAGAGAAVQEGEGGAEACPLDADAASRVLPRVHLYCFARSETEEGAADDALGRLLQVLGIAQALEGWEGDEGEAAASSSSVFGSHLPNLVTPFVLAARRRPGGLPDLLIRWVRNVAPAKHMLCVSFTVPRAVATAMPVWQWAPTAEDAALSTGSSSSSSSSGGVAAGQAGKRPREEEAAGGSKASKAAGRE